MAGLEIIAHLIIFTNIIKAAQPNASFLWKLQEAKRQSASECRLEQHFLLLLILFVFTVLKMWLVVSSAAFPSTSLICLSMSTSSTSPHSLHCIIMKLFHIFARRPSVSRTALSKDESLRFNCRAEGKNSRAARCVRFPTSLLIWAGNTRIDLLKFNGGRSDPAQGCSSSHSCRRARD